MDASGPSSSACVWQTPHDRISACSRHLIPIHPDPEPFCSGACCSAGCLDCLLPGFLPFFLIIPNPKERLPRLLLHHSTLAGETAGRFPLPQANLGTFYWSPDVSHYIFSIHQIFPPCPGYVLWGCLAHFPSLLPWPLLPRNHGRLDLPIDPRAWQPLGPRWGQCFLKNKQTLLKYSTCEPKGVPADNTDECGLFQCLM